MMTGLMMPMRLWSGRWRFLGFAALMAPGALSADRMTTDPVLSGALILAALVLFGTVVLSRWKGLLVIAPVWLLLLAQVPGHTAPTANVTAQTADLAGQRPIARPWG